MSCTRTVSCDLCVVPRVFDPKFIKKKKKRNTIIKKAMHTYFLKYSQWLITSSGFHSGLD